MKRLMPYMFLVAAIIAFVAFGPASGIGVAGTTEASAFKTCKVTRNGGTSASIVATGRAVSLAKGTVLTILGGSTHQGYRAFMARVGGRLQKVAVDINDTNCPG